MLSGMYREPLHTVRQEAAGGRGTTNANIQTKEAAEAKC